MRKRRRAGRLTAPFFAQIACDLQLFDAAAGSHQSPSAMCCLGVVYSHNPNLSKAWTNRFGAPRRGAKFRFF